MAIISKWNLKIYKASYKATHIYRYLLNEMDGFILLSSIEVVCWAIERSLIYVVKTACTDYMP